MSVLFDLDGTLIDSRMRLYRLFQHLVPESNFSFQEYWRLKRNKVTHETILSEKFSYGTEQTNHFREAWFKNIELPEWLALDIPFDGVTTYLADLAKRHELYIVSARQFESGVLSQLSEFSWEGLFQAVLVTEQKLEKFNLVKKYIETQGTDWFVGDTGKDIQTGKKLGLHTAGVLSGFLSEKCLKEYAPDLILDSVLDFNI